MSKMGDIKVWVDKSQSRTRKRKRCDTVQPARPATYRRGQLDRVLTSGARTRSEKHLISLPAAHRTLGTVELVENIILQMPMLQIWGLQRVCKQWKDTITTSKAIRQKMFLEQSDLTAAIGEPVDCAKAGIAFLRNSSLAESMHSAVSATLTPQRIHTRLNPFWAAIYSRYTTSPWTRMPVVSLVPATSGIWTWLHTEVMHDWSLGSWQSMYITDPPCPAIIVICWWKFDRWHTCCSEKLIRNPEGVTVGEVLRVLFFDCGKGFNSRSGGYWSSHVVESLKGRIEEMAEAQYGRLQGRTKFSGKVSVCLTFPWSHVLERLDRGS